MYLHASLPVLLAALASAGEPLLQPTDRRESFGAVSAPSALPAGATSSYLYLGVPELGVGFRQGLAPGEWEARARLDYFTFSATGELLGKYRLYQGGKLDCSPYLGVGLTLSSGARYLDPAAFAFAGLRGLGGVTLGYRATDRVRLVARAEVPVDWPLGQGGGRLRALAGGGAEVYLVDDFTTLLLGQAGLDWMETPQGVTSARFGYAVTLGFGLRHF